MVSKKHRPWSRTLAEKWRDVTITQCEAKFEGCINVFLTPAHSRKKIDIDTEQQYHEIAWCCEKCHNRLDQKMSHAEMELAVRKIIEARDVTF